MSDHDGDGGTVGTADAARSLGVSPSVLRWYADNGWISCEGVAWGRREFPRAEVLRLRMRLTSGELGPPLPDPPSR